MAFITRDSRWAFICGFLIVFIAGCSSSNISVNRSDLSSRSIVVMPVGKISYSNINASTIGVGILPLANNQTALANWIDATRPYEFSDANLASFLSQDIYYANALDEIVKYLKSNYPTQPVTVASSSDMGQLLKKQPLSKIDNSKLYSSVKADLLLEVSILSMSVYKTANDSLYAQGEIRLQLINTKTSQIIGYAIVNNKTEYIDNSAIIIRSREGRPDYAAAVNKSFQVLATNLSKQALNQLIKDF